MIATIGEALIDFIPVDMPDGTRVFAPRPGGSPYNTAIACGRLKQPVLFLARLSTDFFGTDLVANLKKNNVDSSYVHLTSDPTTLAFVRTSPSGDAEYAFFANDSADRRIRRPDLPADLPRELTCIQCGSISTQMEPCGTTIEEYVFERAEKVVVAYDPNIRVSLISDDDAHRKRVLRFMSVSGLVKVSDVDLDWLFPGTSRENAMEEIAALGVPIVVVTAGADGATARNRNGSVHVPAEPPPGGIKDTVGAGDSFHGALLTWLDRNGCMSKESLATLDAETMERSLRFAARAAAITCSRAGAEPPTDNEIDL